MGAGLIGRQGGGREGGGDPGGQVGRPEDVLGRVWKVLLEELGKAGSMRWVGYDQGAVEDDGPWRCVCLCVCVRARACARACGACACVCVLVMPARDLTDIQETFNPRWVMVGFIDGSGAQEKNHGF